MRKGYRIRMTIALLIGVAIGLFGEHWFWEKKEVVVERREPVMRKAALIADKGGQASTDALRRRVADLERQLADALRKNVELAKSVSSAKTAADEASEELVRIGQEQEILSRMKKMRFPHVAFKPPATIIDAVDFFRSASKDYDDPDLPPEKRGFNFVLKVPQGQNGEAEFPPVPTITATDISFYEMLKLVSDSVDYGFKVRGPVVMVMPKADLEAIADSEARPKVE